MKKFIILLTCLMSQMVMAQNFTAEVSQTTLAEKEVLVYSMVLKNISKGQYTPPDFSKDFYIVGGPNQSMQSFNTNGKREAITTISYELRPRAKGSFKIGPASLQVEDKSYKTRSFTITVRQPTAQELQAQRDANKDLFIKVITNKTSAYVGEAITIQFKLYSAVNIGGNEMISQPDFTGFWSKSIDTRSTWKKEYLNGKAYQTALISQYVLVPQSSGNQTIDPMAWNFIVRKPKQRNSRDLFGSMFNRYEEVPTEVSSKPLTLKIKALPKTGKPADFSGAVGSFSLSSTQNKTEVKANNGVDISIKIKGAGNLELFNLPKPEFPTEFDVYDPKNKQNITSTIQGMSGFKSNNYLIIPRVEGNYTIPGLRFTYFDPKSKSYETLSTDDLGINVLQGDTQNDLQMYSSAGKSEVEIKNRDIRFIKLETDLTKKHQPFSSRKGFYIIVLFSALLPIAGFVYRKKQIQDGKKPINQQGNRLRKLAKKELAKAEQALKSGDKDLYFQVLYATFNDYLSRKLNINTSALNRDSIGRALLKIKCNEEDLNKVFGILNTCEMARFAPISKPVENVHEEVITIIELIESK